MGQRLKSPSMLHTSTRSKILPGFVSLAIFLFFAMMLSVPRGYAVGAIMLFLASLYYLASRPRIVLQRADKILIGLFLAVFLAGLISWLYHGNEMASLDLSTRYLMAVPIFLLLLAHPPRLEWLWGGMIVGCMSAAGLAAWQVWIHQNSRAFGFTGGIQFGDIALMMAVLCSAGLAWAVRLDRRAWLWRAALLLGTLSGLYASVMSGTRGGWITLPIVLMVFGAAYLRRSNLSLVIAVCVTLIVGGLVALATVPMVQERYNEALTDVQKFQKGNSNTSIGNRFEMWEALTVIIPQKPWMGWSDTDYNAEKERLIKAQVLAPVAGRLANTHNMFLETWVHQGLLGLVTLAALLLATLLHFGRHLRCPDPFTQLHSIAGVALVSCYIIFGQTQIILGRNNTLLFFIITLSVFWSVMRSSQAVSSSCRCTSRSRLDKERNQQDHD
ncbi:O-antigen ligase family protein [Allopusillimonas ginsengisoli]|uniref:O-antigen ligase family protein n=1 Tax=Allopusillimonas ginsengisoli TaxID=453575 RepID=UPI00102208A1|nr:O-antigen ligase family protein [Allopusillimonas ginsengisoli]TEA77877.1 O-antigen ligase family protein [Allopusillimonas ginsengisoli]